MPKLRAILFDIDDTLFSTSEFARTARENSIRSMIRVFFRLLRCFVEEVLYQSCTVVLLNEIDQALRKIVLSRQINSVLNVPDDDQCTHRGR